MGGKGVAILKRENILHTFPKIKELVGRSIFVSAIVQTENGKFYYFFFYYDSVNNSNIALKCETHKTIYPHKKQPKTAFSIRRLFSVNFQVVKWLKQS